MAQALKKIGTSPKRVGITGCNGIVGRVLRRGLSDRGYEVVAITRKRRPIVSREEAKDDSKYLDSVVENRVADLKDQKQIKGIFDGLDAVIHLAALPRPETEWQKIYENNFPTDHNVFMECLRVGVRRVVYASSNHTQHGLSIANKDSEAKFESFEYDKFGAHLNPPRVIKLEDPVNPDSYYGISKLHGEAQGRFFARQHGLEVVSLRIGWLLPERNPFESDAVKTHEQRQFMRAIYLGHHDCQEFVVHAIEPLPESARLGKGAYVLAYAVSNNPRSLFDLESTVKALGYRPQESIEPYYEEFLKNSEKKGEASKEKDKAEGETPAQSRKPAEEATPTHKSEEEIPGQKHDIRLNKTQETSRL
jgi:nucleoside-diphosphate-sugar epimerase